MTRYLLAVSAVPGHVMPMTALGQRVRLGGRKLAADLTPPGLRRRWGLPDGPEPTPGSGRGPGSPGRLHGHAMTGPAARAVTGRARLGAGRWPGMRSACPA